MLLLLVMVNKIPNLQPLNISYIIGTLLGFLTWNLIFFLWLNVAKIIIVVSISRKVLYKGLNEAGLYPIYGDPFQSNKVLPHFTKSALPPFQWSAYPATRVSSSTWHSKLGHPNSKILQSVLKHLPTPTTDSSSSHCFCKHCNLGKMSQLSFPNSCTHGTEALQLVHSDVWELEPIASINGTKYYVSFIDDFSKFT